MIAQGVATIIERGLFKLLMMAVNSVGTVVLFGAVYS